LAHSPIGLVLGAVLGWVGARVFIRTRISRRASAFVDQLPDTLQLVAGSLRSGFSLNQALAGVVREGTEPTASEFARALAEVRLGSDLEDAIDGAADRMRCEDLRWVVMAVRISREVGGNLAEVLNNTVSTMRERAQLRGQVRALSAEGRVSAKVLIALPFLLVAFLLAFRPGYLDPLFNTAAGIAMLTAGSTLLLLGWFWLSRLVKIEV
jgi:tight adherence protein B